MAVPAGAAVRSGSGTDGPDVAAGGQDIVGFSMAYDEGGAFTATATFREAPNAAQDGSIAVFAGTRQSDGTCGAPATFALTFLDPAVTDAAWATAADATARPATKSVSGNTITIAGTANAAAYDCAWATTRTRTSPSSTLDTTSDVALAAPAPPPPPPTPPAPAPAPAPSPTQSLQASAVPKKVPATVELAVEAPQVTQVKRNRWAKVKVSVANTGRKTASKVTLKLGTARGVQAKRRTVTFKRIRGGKKGTATLQVRLTKKARTTSTLSARASVKGAKTAKGSLVLRIGAAKKKSSGKAAPVAETLVGKAFAHGEPDVMSSTDWSAYYFVNDQFLYRGVPEGGIPQCTAKTAVPDKDGDPGDGCVPYTFDPNRGVVTIDGVEATIDPTRTLLKVGEREHALAIIPKPGTRWQGELRGISIWGFWPNQTVNQRWLTTNMNGEFALTKSTMGQMGTTNFAVAPPDSRGVYEVLPNGLLRMTYADGKIENWTMTILRDAKTGDENPATAGFLLDDTQYFLDTDD